MTLLDPTQSSRPALPGDMNVLRMMAERLDGRPVPGVRMTLRQFVEWCPEKVRAEWVDGEVVLMTMTTGRHSDLVLWIARVMAEVVDHDDCGIVRGPEFGIRLAKRIRVPDVLFVAKNRLALLDEQYLKGPPDLAVEVVSTDSVSRDWRVKYLEYEQAGIREYWVVDPLVKRMEAYSLRGGKYRQLPADGDGNVRSKVLKNFYLRDGWVFGTPLPKPAVVLREMGIR